jgi:hypothetical protein
MDDLPAVTPEALAKIREWALRGGLQQQQAAAGASTQDGGWWRRPVPEALAHPIGRTFGIGGHDRYQTWPERLVRDIIGLPGAVEQSGNLPVGSRESIDALIPGAQAITGLAGGAGAFMAPRNSLGAAGRRPPPPGLPMDAASRLARAEDMGMRLNMPLIFGRAPAGERIAAAAVRVGDRVFTGSSHAEAMLKAERALGKPFEDLPLGPMPDGFVTTSRRFVSRHEAPDIANAGRQSKESGVWPGYAGLTADKLIPSAPPPAAGAYTAATAPGLPGGGGGVWGVWKTSGRGLGRGETALVHRAGQPASVDVAGRSIPEIHATLQQAWDLGKDSVLLKNYTRPGGKVPENVVVVRDRAQLRDPQRAVFDPARIGSPDLTAGIAAGAIAVPVIWGSLSGGRR